MTQPTVLPISPFCAHLRSKKYYFLDGPARSEADVLDASGDCWCHRTLAKLGPDKDVVDPEDCRRGRTCYESI